MVREMHVPLTMMEMELRTALMYVHSMERSAKPCSSMPLMSALMTMRMSRVHTGSISAWVETNRQPFLYVIIDSVYITPSPPSACIGDRNISKTQLWSWSSLESSVIHKLWIHRNLLCRHNTGQWLLWTGVQLLQQPSVHASSLEEEWRPPLLDQEPATLRDMGRNANPICGL